MNKQIVKKDTRLPKLPVVCSEEVKNTIESIVSQKQDNPNELAEWKEDILCLLNYISNPVVAWDYIGKYPHDENGTVFFEDFGYKIDYIVMTGNDDKNYVSVIYAELNPGNFGLRENREKNNCLLVAEYQSGNLFQQCAREVLSEERRKIGKWTIVDGNSLVRRAPSLRQFGEFYDVRMYDEQGAKPFNTICLMQRRSSLKYFYAIIADAPELGHLQTKYVPIKLQNVPKIILKDTLPVIRSRAKEHNLPC